MASDICIRVHVHKGGDEQAWDGKAVGKKCMHSSLYLQERKEKESLNLDKVGMR